VPVLGYERYEGMCHSLIFDATLEPVSAKGQTAVFSRHYKTNFLKTT
jgi:hypothetical protein